jgi:hypothetical protein
VNPGDGAVPRLVLPDPDVDVAGSDGLKSVVIELQRLMLKYPVAMQAAYRALVAEGRRFAATDEGRAWQARLEASPAVSRAQALWEAATFNALDAEGESPLPTALVDMVAYAISRGDLEIWLARFTELTMV